MRADTGRPGQHAMASMACWLEDGGAGAAPHHLRRRSSQLEVEPRLGGRPAARPSSPRPIPAARRGDTFPPNSCASRSPSPSPFDGEGSPVAAARRSSRHSLAASPCRAAAVLRDWQEEFALPEFRPRSSSVAVPARRAQLTRGHRVPERHAGWLDPGTASAPQRRAARSPDAETARVRSFITTSRGVVSRGDSTPRDLPTRHHTPPTTPASSLTSSGRTSPALSQSPPTGPPPPTPTPSPPTVHHVVPLGGAGVGKTALVRQFLSSEYMNGYDTAGGGVHGAPALTVYVDERETRLVFDEPAGVQLEELADSPGGGSASAFLVIYSVTDAASFSEAAALLLRLYACGAMYRHVVILVGNKADLVRARVVSTPEGRHLAMAHGCKFIECSGGMNHRVDELLAGLASQLRLRADGAARGGCQRRRGSLGFLDKLLHRQSHSKSCQNLFT